MATVLDVQAGNQGTGQKVEWGIDSVTHAFVPNPLNSGLVDIGAPDATVRAIYTAGGLVGKLAKTTYGAAATFSLLEEEITLSTSGLTTDSVANLLPANSIILAVTGIVTTTITTTTSWGLSDPTTANRFAATNSTLTAGTTSVGIVQWSGASTTLAAGPSQPSAAKVRITCVGSNPGAGKVRVSVLALVFNAATS